MQAATGARHTIQVYTTHWSQAADTIRGQVQAVVTQTACKHDNSWNALWVQRKPGYCTWVRSGFKILCGGKTMQKLQDLTSFLHGFFRSDFCANKTLANGSRWIRTNDRKAGLLFRDSDVFGNHRWWSTIIQQTDCLQVLNLGDNLG